VEEASLLYTDIVIRGAEARAAAHGYSLLLCGAGENHPAGMTPLLNLTGTVDGLIVLDRVMTEDDVADLSRRIPVVLLAGAGDSSSAITVRVDNEQAMRSLAEHFVEVHQVKRVGFVSGHEGSPDSVARELSFKATIAEAARHWRTSTFSSLTGRRPVAKRPCGHGSEKTNPCRRRSLAPTIKTAVGVIYALHAAGLRVPEDVLVSGFDDITLTRYFKPPLTDDSSIGQSFG